MRKKTHHNTWHNSAPSSSSTAMQCFFDSVVSISHDIAEQNCTHGNWKASFAQFSKDQSAVNWLKLKNRLIVDGRDGCFDVLICFLLLGIRCFWWFSFMDFFHDVSYNFLLHPSPSTLRSHNFNFVRWIIPVDAEKKGKKSLQDHATLRQPKCSCKCSQFSSTLRGLKMGWNLFETISWIRRISLDVQQINENHSVQD